MRELQCEPDQHREINQFSGLKEATVLSAVEPYQVNEQSRYINHNAMPPPQGCSVSVSVSVDGNLASVRRE